MNGAKRRTYNELFADQMIRLLLVELSVEKCWVLLEDVLNLEVKAL